MMHDIVPDSAVSLVLRGQRFIVAYLHVKLLFEHPVRSLKLRLTPCVCDRSHERNIRRNAQQQKCSKNDKMPVTGHLTEQGCENEIDRCQLRKWEERKYRPLLDRQTMLGFGYLRGCKPENEHIKRNVGKTQQKCLGVEPKVRSVIVVKINLGINKHYEQFVKQYDKGGK